MIAYVGRGCCKEHIIPVFRRGVSFDNFPAFTHLPIQRSSSPFYQSLQLVIISCYFFVNRVTIDPVVLCSTTTIDKTLFNEITTEPERTGIDDITRFFGPSKFLVRWRYPSCNVRHSLVMSRALYRLLDLLSVFSSQPHTRQTRSALSLFFIPANDCNRF